MRLARRTTGALLAALLLTATPAAARTVLLGSNLGDTIVAEQQCLATGCTLLQQTFAPPQGAIVLAAPAAGTITSWRARGLGPARLRVLRPQPDGSYLGAGTSATATLTEAVTDFP